VDSSVRGELRHHSNKTEVTRPGLANGGGSGGLMLITMRHEMRRIDTGCSAAAGAIMRFDEDVACVLRGLPGSGPLFPYLRSVRDLFHNRPLSFAAWRKPNRIRLMLLQEVTAEKCDFEASHKD
jgi:hypothetical protein